MSEFINNIEERRNELIAFSVGIINGGKRKEYINRYQKAIDNLSAEDVIFVVHELVEKYNVEVVKDNIGKILNIFYEPLKNLKRTKAKKNSFIFILEKENREAEKILKKIKELLKRINKEQNNIYEIKEELKSYFLMFQDFEKHYSKKENIFFPYFEKKYEHYTCLKVMWAFHDEIRDSFTKNIEILEKDKLDLKLLNKETGRFFFAVVPVIFREEYILHPFALELFSKKEFNEMLLQSFEIGFAFIETPNKPKPIIEEEIKTQDYSELGNLFADLETGILSHEQIKMMINHLPVDITFVDENDTVRFFSNPKHRFFTRSKAIIGRTVQNCHPHESVHIVDKIVDSFKTGKKDKARFWIQMKGRFILIEYYALRNNAGEYKGTIEVSQDITELRQLKGEQRLKRKSAHILKIFIIFILFFPKTGFSQNSFFNDTHLRINYLKGFLLPEYDFITFLTNDNITGYELDVYKELTGKKLWHRVYKYPSIGISFIHTSLGNDEVFGNATAINPYIRFNLLSKQKFKLEYNLGVGLAYANKKFDLNTNYQDIPIGSHLNIWFNTELSASYKIYKNISLTGGTVFNHISNANLAEPNIGLNLWDLMLGIDAEIGKTTEKNIDPVPKFKPLNQFAVILAGANKHTRRFAEETYFTASASFEYKRILGHKISLGTGADLFYDSSVPDEMFREGISEIKDLYKYKTGFHFSQELIIGKLSLGIQEGIYILLTDKLNKNIMYNRGIMRYKISDNLFLNLAMKSNIVVLDVMEIGIGYYWN